MAGEENAKPEVQTAEAPPAEGQVPMIAITVLEHPLTRAMTLDMHGLPNEIVIEVLSRALRYAERQALIAELLDRLQGPKIVGPGDAPHKNGGMRRFLGGR